MGSKNAKKRILPGERICVVAKDGEKHLHAQVSNRWHRLGLPMECQITFSQNWGNLVRVVVTFNVSIYCSQNNHTYYNRKNTDNNDRIEYPIPVNFRITIYKKEIPPVVPLNSFLNCQQCCQGQSTSSLQYTEYVYVTFVDARGSISFGGWLSKVLGHFSAGPLILFG